MRGHWSTKTTDLPVAGADFCEQEPSSLPSYTSQRVLVRGVTHSCGSARRAMMLGYSRRGARTSQPLLRLSFTLHLAGRAGGRYAHSTWEGKGAEGSCALAEQEPAGPFLGVRRHQVPAARAVTYSGVALSCQGAGWALAGAAVPGRCRF